MTLFLKPHLFAVFLLGTSWTIIATERTPNEFSPLNSGSAKYYMKIQDEPQQLPVEGKRTARFRQRVEKLEIKFQNFDSLSDEQKNKLLDTYQKSVIGLGQTMKIVRNGFDDRGVSITDETKAKLTKVLLIYQKHRKQSNCGIQ